MAAAFAACLLLALDPDVRSVLARSALSLGWRPVIAAAAIQLASLFLCGIALRCVGRELRLRDCLYVRWLRDAGGNLLVILPGLGEVAGVRAFALLGVSASSAVGALALDTLAESCAQAPYAAQALLISPHLRDGLARLLDLRTVAVGATVVLSVLLLLGAFWSRWRRKGRARDFICGVAAALRRNGRGLWTCGALHLAGWTLGGVQVWAAATLLHLKLGLADALALESLVYVGRGVAVFAPAGLGVQEAGFILGGSMLGLSAPAALSISLALRCRDLMVGSPALLVWLGLELGDGSAVGPARQPKGLDWARLPRSPV